MALELPLPHLAERTLDAINIVTDDALAQELGVRVVFTGRFGGVSEGPYASLNLGAHVGDDLESVLQNRTLLAQAVGCNLDNLISLNQVHGTNLVSVNSASPEDVERVRGLALSEAGADGIIVGIPGVAALLCFADCVPVAIVSPTGLFAVVHAGWRGVDASIASKAVLEMAEAEASLLGGVENAASCYNVYIGPHIRKECFETGVDVHERFVAKFGRDCACGDQRISLADALRVDLVRVGVSPQRIVDAEICTVCNHEEYFSYRASGGVCGRHGALAYREA